MLYETTKDCRQTLCQSGGRVTSVHLPYFGLPPCRWSEVGFFIDYARRTRFCLCFMFMLINIAYQSSVALNIHAFYSIVLPTNIPLKFAF